MTPRKLAVIVVARGFIVFVWAGLIGFPLLIGVAMKTPYDFVGMTDTEYAPGYSRAKFRTIKVGDSAASVLASLGEPYRRYKHWTTYRWIWEDTGINATFDDSKVIAVEDPSKRIRVGMTHREVGEIMGYTHTSEGVAWDKETWFYSYSPKSTHYWKVFVTVDAVTGTVIEKYEGFYWD